MAGKRVLELGSGCGLLGLTAVMLGANATMTDLADVMPTLCSNLQRNLNQHAAASSALCPQMGKAEVRELDWTNEEALRRVGAEEWDIVLASDVMYSDSVFSLFFGALTTILSMAKDGQGRGACSRRSRPKVLVGHKQRSADEQRYLDTVLQRFEVTLAGRAFGTDVYLWETRKNEP